VLEFIARVVDHLPDKEFLSGDQALVYRASTHAPVKPSSLLTSLALISV
jgi:hypothetical protein